MKKTILLILLALSINSRANALFTNSETDLEWNIFESTTALAPWDWQTMCYDEYDLDYADTSVRATG
jgi:hypothetical protein